MGTIGMKSTEGTSRLCHALYKRSPVMQDWQHGANARMLHDAATAIHNLRRACRMAKAGLIIALSVLGLLWVDHVAGAKEKHTIQTHYQYQADSLSAALGEMERRQAQCMNRLAGWQRYASGQQYGSTWGNEGTIRLRPE